MIYPQLKAHIACHVYNPAFPLPVNVPHNSVYSFYYHLFICVWFTVLRPGS